MIYHSRFPSPVIPDLPLPGYVLEHAAAYGSRPALIDGLTGAAVSYAALPGAIAAAAGRLRAQGAGPGTAVGLAAVNQPAWAIAFYAVLATGAAAVPLNPTFTPHELRELTGLAGASLLLADGQAGPAAARAFAGRDRAPVPLAGIAPAEEAGSAAPDPVAAGIRARDAAGAAGATDPAVIAFSSGTTGLPKPVLLSHRNLVATLAQHEGIYSVGPGDVVLAALPMFHIYGLSIILGYALRHGATVVTLPRFALDDYLRLIGEQRATWLHLAPPLALQLLSPAAAAADLSSVRHAVSGAAPLDAGVAARLEARLGCRVLQGYGMTEASPGVTWVPDDGGACPPGSVGFLVGGTEARVVDPVSGADTGGPGELWVRGPQVMAGYLGAPAATAAALVEDGWLRTGDIMRVDAGGAWWVVDRLKELIKYKGYQVAPAELEGVLLAHPAVADVAVAGMPDPVAGEIPVAWAVTRAPVGEAELMAWVSERVAPYKRIRAVRFIDAVPRSPAGKVLRRQLTGRDGPGPAG